VRKKRKAELPHSLCSQSLAKKTKDPILAQLTVKQRNALPHFLIARPLRDCCLAANVNKTEYYHWIRRSQAWCDALESFQQDVLMESKQNIYRQMQKASEVLCDLMENSRNETKLRAIEIVLNFSMRFIDQDKIIKSIEDLREAHAKSNDQSRSSKGTSEDARASSIEQCTSSGSDASL